MRPICYDLFCGLGGWSEGFLAEGYECRGYDIEAHDYGTGGYPGTLILRDVRSIHGSEFKDATVIVASPPCQAYSYRAMPWSRAKALPPPDNELFNSCFRIQREAIEAAGHYIPMVVENVRGAQKWVGRAQWHYGSFYLWGDVPALMPTTLQLKAPGKNWNEWKDWDGTEENKPASLRPWGDEVKTVGHANIRDGHTHTRHLTNQRESDAVKQTGISGLRNNGKGDAWFQDGAARHGSNSNSRKAASAMIAKIPFPLAQWIAKAYKPEGT
jgi:hypothetical protein